jgi:C-terminal processing protease CtpA/Prc
MLLPLRLGIIAAVFLLAGFGPLPVVAQSAPERPAETRRIERLAALGQLWGTIKFFHPYLAYRAIDRDKALVDAIPRVRAARTPEEYRRAVDGMLAVLGDPATRAVLPRPTAAPPAPSSAAAAAPVQAAPPPAAAHVPALRTVGGALVLNAAASIAALQAAMQAREVKQFEKIRAERESRLAAARWVVLDARFEAPADDIAADNRSFAFETFLQEILPRLIDRSVPLGTTRYRMHSGYPPQRGQTSGGYFSAFVTNGPRSLAGQRARGSAKPFAILINRGTPNQSELWSGLQAAGVARVVRERPALDVGPPTARVPGEAGAAFTFRQTLPDGATVTIRQAEVVSPDGRAGFQPDVQVPVGVSGSADAALTAAVNAVTHPPRRASPAAAAAAPAALVSSHDEPYAAMTFPSAEYRLLALFRFWNVIQFFYPYKRLIGEPWEGVLVRFIPRFEADRNALDYQQTVQELVAAIHDSHGYVSGADQAAASLGTHCPPVIVRSVEGRTIIVGLPDAAAAQAAGLHVGDEVVSVDGEPVAARGERLGRLLSASTLQSLRGKLHWELLAGPEKRKALLGIRSGDPPSPVRVVEMERTLPFVTPPPRSTPVYGVLPSGCGYIDLARLPLEDAGKAMDAVAKTPALIFDMRGYPHGTAWAIAPRLTDKKVVAARFERPEPSALYLGDSDYAEGPRLTFDQTIEPDRSQPRYTGRVVMLINEEAISQAEHTCLFFEAATHVTFIGSPTAGANGDVTNCVLPGGLYITFSGHDVRHADGRQLQRVGIQPDIPVEPTVKGVREGRDEVLEAALRFLQKPE